MGLFGFGGSTSRSSSRSSSSSYDNLDQSSFDLGFDSSRSENFSRGSSFQQSDQVIAFEDVFSELFADAGGAAGRIAANSGMSTAAANMLFNSGRGIISDLQDGGAGADYLSGRLEGDGLVDEQIDLLSQDVTRFLTEEALPAVDTAGVSAGTLGGSRNQIGRGIASRGATEAFTRGAVDIRSRDQAQRDAVARDLMSAEAARGGMALDAMPNLFGLLEAGQMAELSPYMALSQIVGPMQTLTTSRGGSEQISEALAEAFGLNVGGSTTVGRARSTSSSESSSRGRSLRFGFE